MKTPLRLLIYFVCGFGLLVGCGPKAINTIEVDTNLNYHVIAIEHKTQLIFFCWFVEDNGAGKSGYDLQEVQAGAPPDPNRQLFPTIDSVRETIKVYGGKSPVVIPREPGLNPAHWKVRNLNGSEVKDLERRKGVTH